MLALRPSFVIGVVCVFSVVALLRVLRQVRTHGWRSLRRHGPRGRSRRRQAG